MIYPIVILLISFIGIAVFIGRRFLSIKNLSDEEVLYRMESTKPFGDDLRDLMIAPIAIIVREKAKPFVYKEIEKLTRRFRIMFLKIECRLLRFAEYIRGKRIMQKNCQPSSPYWQNLNDLKNELKNNGNDSGSGSETTV